jgi:nucleoside-diphosphate-sugar epimerase
MKTLIIGGNRFFGRKLAALLLKQGHQVTLLNRGALADGLGASVKRIRCDRTDEEQMNQLLEGQHFDVVYDQVCFDAQQASAAVKIFQQKTKRYIFTSSMSIYPMGDNLQESDFDPSKYEFSTYATFESDYAEAKRQAETRFFTEANFEVVAVRFPIVLGEDDHTQRLKMQIMRIKNQEAIHFPNLEAHLSCINSDDAASALLKLGSSKFTGPLNVASHDSIYLKALVQQIEEATGKKAILAQEAEGVLTSPYGIDSDWILNTSLAIKNHITPAPINTWLPALIKKLS